MKKVPFREPEKERGFEAAESVTDAAPEVDGRGVGSVARRA